MGILRYIIRVDLKRQIVQLVLVILKVLLGLLPFHLLRYILDSIVPARDTTRLYQVAAALFVLVLARMLAEYAHAMAAEQIRQRVMQKLRGELFAHVMRLGPDFFARQSIGQITSRVQTEVGRLGTMIASIFVQPVVEVMTFLFYGMYLLSMNWLLTLLAVATLPLVALAVAPINRSLSRNGKQFTNDVAAYGATLQESLSASFEVQVHGTYGYEQHRHDERQRTISRTWLRDTHYNALLGTLSELSRGVGPILVYTYGALMVIDGRMQVGEIVAFSGVLSGLYLSMDRLIKYPPMLRGAQDRFDEICEYFQVPPTYVDPPAAASVDNVGQGMRVEMRHVQYWHGTQCAVPDLSLAVEPGEHAAFCGRSGSGKSTALNLIAGRLRPRAGEVLLDGVPIEKLPVAAMAETVGYVGQFPFLFATTIRNNLLYALLRLPDTAPTRDAGGDLDASFLDTRPLRQKAPESAAAALRDSGLSDLAALDDLLIAACRDVGLEQELFEFGLQARISAEQGGPLLEVRRALAPAVASDDAMEIFHPDRYLSRVTVAENLVFAPLHEDGSREKTLARWVEAAAAPSVQILELLVASGWQAATRDLDYLKRVAAENPRLLAEFGVDEEHLAERVRLVELVRNRELKEAVVGTETCRALARLGLDVHEEDPERRERLVGSRKSFQRALGPDAPVPYDPERWHPALSVRENVLFASTDTSNLSVVRRYNKAIREAVDATGCTQAMLKLGLGFEVGERGLRLSGGQKQKISIARVLLKAPRLLLLDEATASLDQGSASQIHELLKNSGRTCTIVAVTHQLVWVEGFDRVVVFENGHVAEQGRPTDLLSSGGALRDLHDAAAV